MEALGRAAGVDPEALLRWLEERYRQRRRWRRRRVPVCTEPPPAPGKVDPGEAAEVAEEACGARAYAWLPGPEGGFRRGRRGAANSPELARAWDGLKGGGR
ncbi:MAG: hypothetical protein H5T97_12815 [Firmicutes bacterium]|nr:hypothetical protein [Bacillota bacterium]